MKRILVMFLAAAMAAMFSACNKTADNGPGRLVIRVTDAPFPMDIIESATVTISKVEIRKAGDGVSDGNPFITLTEEPKTFDLVDLRNGLVGDLLDLEIPQGTYDLVRLYVEDASLKIKDGGDYDVKVPSGQQTGIKVFITPGLIVQGGLTEEVILDFDLSKSFVLKGNPLTPAGIKGFNFKPVIRAVNNTTAGQLEGMVTDTGKVKVKIKEASVWVMKDTIVASTVADTMGYYKIIGIPAGTYSVFAAKEAFDTLKVEGVNIAAGNKTVLNLELFPK